MRKKTEEKPRLAARAIAEPRIYPAGSLREKRDAMLSMIVGLRAQIKDCRHCDDLRASANRIENEIEEMRPAIREEITAEEKGVTVKRVVYTGTGLAPPLPASVEYVAREDPKRRACSLCRKPGHRAQNCPDAHKADPAVVKAKARRRKR